MSKPLLQLAQLRACLSSQTRLPSDPTLFPMIQTLHHGAMGASELVKGSWQGLNTALL